MAHTTEQLTENPELAAEDLQLYLQNVSRIAEMASDLEDIVKNTEEMQRNLSRQIETQKININQLEEVRRFSNRCTEELAKVSKDLEVIKQASMPLPAAKLFAMLGIFSGILFLASNLAAMKLLNFFSFPIDGGILLFPITYVIDDIIKEVYGERMMNALILANSVFCVVIWGLLQLVQLVPDPLFHNQNASFYAMMSGMGRIFLASIIASLISRLVDNFFYAMDFRNNPKHPQWCRALISSILSRAFDMVIFDLAAFLGQIPISSLAKQLFLAYVLATVIESLLAMIVESPLSDYIAIRINYRHGKNL